MKQEASDACSRDGLNMSVRTLASFDEQALSDGVGACSLWRVDQAQDLTHLCGITDCGVSCVPSVTGGSSWRWLFKFLETSIELVELIWQCGLASCGNDVFSTCTDILIYSSSILRQINRGVSPPRSSSKDTPVCTLKAILNSLPSFFNPYICIVLVNGWCSLEYLSVGWVQKHRQMV